MGGSLSTFRRVLSRHKEKISNSEKLYVSAIKNVLMDDGISLNENKFIINALTRACKLKNDQVRTRLQIQRKMMDMLLSKTQKVFSEQPYLSVMYTTLFSTAYYGLFRVGELTSGTHRILVTDVHMAENKQKILFLLRTSKTHGRDSKPQLVKIQSKSKNGKSLSQNQSSRSSFCPYQLLRRYIRIRPRYINDKEPFFIFRDFSPVTPEHMRSTLKLVLEEAGFRKDCYDTHSFRIGRTTDLVNQMGISIETAKKLGRWRSNCIYKYIS